MNNKPIAIVTGGAGFIGSHMADLLISKNYEVRVIDNMTGGHERNIQHLQNNNKEIVNTVVYTDYSISESNNECLDHFCIATK